MPRVKKSSVRRMSAGKVRRMSDDVEHNETEDQDLPSDEAGRLKIKKNYEELLGIRVEKLKGRVLNREKINKTIEGVYFICALCKRICHNLDEGLLEDPNNQNNLCGSCAKEKGLSGTA